MSLILDALKKSEQSRKRGGAPGIADAPSAGTAAPTPRWIVPLIVLLTLNAIVVLFAMTRGADEPTGDMDREPPAARASEPIAGDAGSASQASAALPPLPRRTEVRSLSREVAVSTPPPGEPRPVPRESAADATTTAAAPVPTPAPTTTAAPSAQTSADLPRYDEVRTRLNLPELHVDLHVYHPEPSRRLAYINGVKLAIGETASAGYRVSDIVSDGVTLEFRGTEFLLPRD